MQQRLRRRDGSVMSLAQSKRASELERDLNAWEENRLITSGVVRLREVRPCHVCIRSLFWVLHFYSCDDGINRFSCAFCHVHTTDGINSRYSFYPTTTTGGPGPGR